MEYRTPTPKIEYPIYRAADRSKTPRNKREFCRNGHYIEVTGANCPVCCCRPRTAAELQMLREMSLRTGPIYPPPPAKEPDLIAFSPKLVDGGNESENEAAAATIDVVVKKCDNGHEYDAGGEGIVGCGACAVKNENDFGSPSTSTAATAKVKGQGSTQPSGTSISVEKGNLQFLPKDWQLRPPPMQILLPSSSSSTEPRIFIFPPGPIRTPPPSFSGTGSPAVPNLGGQSALTLQPPNRRRINKGNGRRRRRQPLMIKVDIRLPE